MPVTGNGAPQRTGGKPADRLTRLCDAMTSALEADPEYRDGDKAIVMLDDGSRGGIVLHGYDDDMQAMADLLTHLGAVFEAGGKTLRIGFGQDPMSAAVRALSDRDRKFLLDIFGILARWTGEPAPVATEFTGRDGPLGKVPAVLNGLVR